MISPLKKVAVALVLIVLISSLLLLYSGCRKKAKEKAGQEVTISGQNDTQNPSNESKEGENKGTPAANQTAGNNASQENTGNTGTGGGSGGGGGSGSSGGSSLTTCQKASRDGLCNGLNLTYGEGYQTICCTDEGVCC